MAYKKAVKYIVWNEDWTGLAFVEENDPTIDNYDYALPVAFAEKDPDKKAERLPELTLVNRIRRVGTL
jgi:hypothetical protein